MGLKKLIKNYKEMGRKEFFEKWKQGIMSVTPLVSTKINIMGGVIVLGGVLTGLVSTFILAAWWLFVILLGSLFLTANSLIGYLQKYYILKDIDRQIKESSYIG